MPTNNCIPGLILNMALRGPRGRWIPTSKLLSPFSPVCVCAFRHRFRCHRKEGHRSLSVSGRRRHALWLNCAYIQPRAQRRQPWADMTHCVCAQSQVAIPSWVASLSPAPSAGAGVLRQGNHVHLRLRPPGCATWIQRMSDWTS